MDRKKMIRLLTLFLALMLIFTVLSRAADSAGIAHVGTKTSQSMTIDHTVSGSGKVVQNREQAVSAIENQKVKTVYVNEGEAVEQGAVLFDLDIGELKKQILEKKREIEKMDLQSQDGRSKSQVEEELKENQKKRAGEDVSLAAAKGDLAISRALEALWKSRQVLEEYRAAKGQESGGEDAVLAELLDSVKEKEKACQKAEEERKALERKIERAVNKALDEAESKNRQLLQKAGRPMGIREEGAETASGAALGAAPEASPGAASEATSGTASGASPETAPEASPGAAPEASPGAAPEASPGAAPEATSGTASGASPGTASGASPETENLAAVEKRVRGEYRKELEKAQSKQQKAEAEKEAANQAVQQYQQELADRQSADAEGKEQQLVDDVNVKQQAYDDAVAAKDEGVLSAGRSLEDANAPVGSDSSDKISRLDQDKLQMELQEMEALLDAGGQIKAPIKGTITKIAVTTGEKTVDGTAVLMADTTNGSKFTAQIPADQEKYIAKNDPVTLKPANNGNPIDGLKIESVKAGGESEDMLEVTVNLPPDSLEIGTAAEFEATRTSQTYSCCIPIAALHQENNDNFVYVLQETDSILGKELTAQKVIVRVLEKNESYAAIQEGGVTSEQKIITESDKAISGGSRVRLMEE